MDDLISRQATIIQLSHNKNKGDDEWELAVDNDIQTIWQLPSAQPEIIRCKDCKFNPKYEWFGCPMSHLSEKQRPETAWCWKAERRTSECD